MVVNKFCIYDPEPHLVRLAPLDDSICVTSSLLFLFVVVVFDDDDVLVVLELDDEEVELDELEGYNDGVTDDDATDSMDSVSFSPSVSSR